MDVLYKRFFKRPLDFILSLIALILLSPVLIIVGILIRIKLGAPVVFRQQRPGQDEKVFTMYKFRTMTDAYDNDGNLLPDSQRLTTFGSILRKTSLDELPELINVIKGDMSLIGPRPLVIKYLPYYNQQQRRRHEVLPGITGLAQINGRNNIMWEERFNYDVNYVENISFLLDIHILFVTVKKVIARSDIGSRKENDTDIGIEDFDKHCMRNQLTNVS